MLSLRNVDWSETLIDRCEYAFQPIPVIAQNSPIYQTLLLWIDILEKSLIPAEPKYIITVLSLLRLHFPTESMSEKLSEILIKEYVFDLEEFPLDLIIFACNEYRYDCNSKFFPSIAKLLAIIKPHIYKRKLKLSRLKKLKEVSEA